MTTERSIPNWPSRSEWGIIVAFWGTFALISIGQGFIGEHAGHFHWTDALGDLLEYGAWTLITPFVFWFVGTVPVIEMLSDDTMRAVRNVGLHTITGLATAILVDVSEDLFGLHMGPSPPGASAGSPPTILQQIQNLWFLDELGIYLIVLMAGFARIYYLQKKKQQEEAERLEERAESLEAQLTEARLEALRMQLNPHFLFNTLHAVSTLVDRDPSGVRRMIARLSELLRHVLDEDAPQEVPLSQELDFLNDYLDIQTIRFQGELDTEIDVPSELHEAQVPNLILQPVVENAIKHGASQVRGVGRIEIHGRREDDRLVLSVRDNGPGLPPSQEDGLGLRNVRARLQELYGENQSLRLESDPDKGTHAILEIPYHSSTALYTAEGESTLTAALPSSVE
ncbi:histidine kinase [Salinibacter sp. 10B]|uniref:sensor histidine kinase n=1 Tax=Salinibacter sp. 10B TaxID=1923971 RepID=UPI002157B388|nr:histidine kinase [Salinibacter sp. 10B]